MTPLFFRKKEILHYREEKGDKLYEKNTKDISIHNPILDRMGCSIFNVNRSFNNMAQNGNIRCYYVVHYTKLDNRHMVC